MIIINIPSICVFENTILISSLVEYSNKKIKLWFEIDKNYNNWLTTSIDPFLIGLILPAMKTGEDILLKGNVSKDLFFNLSTSFQDIIIKLIPSLKKINIKCENNFYNSAKKQQHIITGFSGGIDSYCTLDDYFFNPKIQDYKITHLLFNQVGAHGKKQETFVEKYQNLKQITNQLGLPFIKVNSNLREFYEGLSFKQTHTVRNSVIPHLFEPMISKFLYSSGYNYKDIKISAADDSAYIDPIILPLLSTSNMSLLSVGSEYTRVEKTKKVSKLKITYKSLDVCTDNKRKTFLSNCSECSKCLRTMLTLDLNNSLKEYSSVFNIEKYHSLKESYISTLSINSPLELEILEHIKVKE